ncbi:MAG TPA: hypothetical protein VGQ65_07435 [Thermoanaerobaculia bacterium]|jgi:hypothetical protein|nr:hypothetical protein [Thermoanaerobaculia bacterium]
MDNKNKPHDSNPDPITGEPGAHPLGVAGGASGGALAGAAIGAVGGPIGAAVGGAIGAVAGGLAGKAAGEAVNPTEEDTYWREHHTSRPYFKSGRTYDDYRPAYAYGWESAGRYHGRKFEDVESDLSRGWDKARGATRSEWSDMKAATRDAFDRAQTRMSPGMTRASETTSATVGSTTRSTNNLSDENELRNR